MLTVGKDGEIIDDGHIWELTEQDLTDMACMIAEHTVMPGTVKKDGRWTQVGGSDTALEGIYQVISGGEVV